MIAYTVQAKSYTSYDPVPLSTIYPVKDDSARALIALAATYAPTEDEAGSDVFTLVRRFNDGNWYLDRILSGPGIPLQ